MAYPRLRIYFGPDDSSTTAVAPAQKRVEERVTVPLGDVLPLLADAARNRRAWLQDFDDETVTLSADLYEVLMAYEHLRPSA